MIFPRFNTDIPGSEEPDDGAGRSVHIHLHVPAQIASVLMQLVTACTTQRSLFTPEVFSDISGHSSSHRSHPTQPGGLGPASEPAATPLNDTPSAVNPATVGTEVDCESLLGAYRRLLKAKRQRSASPGTVGDHEGSMRKFDAFFAQMQEKAGVSPESGVSGDAVKTLHRLSTPEQCLADADLIRAFVMSEIQDDRSTFTVNRRLTHLGMLAKALKVDFDKPTPDEVRRLQHEEASKKPRTHKRAKPNPDQPAEPLPDRRIPSFLELDAMARHVDGTRYPYGDHAPYFWRGWIRYLALYGPRSRDVVSPIPRKHGLQKSDVIFESACPVADVSNALGRELHSPHGWLWYTIGKDHSSDCRRILLPMPLWLRNWVRFFLEFSHHPVRVFPSCQRHSKALSQDKLTISWQAILAAAAVDPRIIPSEGNGDSIAIRKFAANWWQLNTLAAKGDSSLADKMSHYVLHHREVTTANRHYLNVQAAVLPVMIELLDRWQKPAADAPPVSMLPE